MKTVLIALIILLAGTLLHFLFLWMEKKGWIYYKHNAPSRTRLGNAFLEIQSILEPDKKHVIEVRDEIRKETQAQGDDPDGKDATLGDG
jgi:hypothetical protein